MKLALVLFALALTGQGAGNQSVGVEFNGRRVPVVGYDDGGRVNWTAETQDWGGHPPTTALRTPGEPAPNGWYAIQVNGSPTVVKGYLDASGRLVWRWSDQVGGSRPNPATMSAFDPRANGVDFQSLAPGVQASDATSRAEVEAVISQAADDPGRPALPDVVGVGVNWPKVATYAFIGLAALVGFGACVLFVLMVLWRFLTRAKR